MEIKLTLTLDETNAILTVLSEAPYKIAEPLITKIRSQAQPQVAPKEE